MNAAATLIAEFHQRGIRLIPDPPKLAVEPSSKLTDADPRASANIRLTYLPYSLLTGTGPRSTA
jgi:hypothetical protein